MSYVKSLQKQISDRQINAVLRQNHLSFCVSAHEQQKAEDLEDQRNFDEEANKTHRAVFQSDRKLDYIDVVCCPSIESNHYNNLGRSGTVTYHPAELSRSVQSRCCLRGAVLPFQ